MFVRRKKYNDLIEAMSREQSRHDQTTFQRNQLLHDNKTIGDLVLYYKAKSDRLQAEAIARDKNGQFAKIGRTYNHTS